MLYVNMRMLLHRPQLLSPITTQNAQGDKLDTILATLKEMVGLCERGFDLTVWLIAAWKVSLEEKSLQKALECQRIGGCVPACMCVSYE